MGQLDNTKLLILCLTLLIIGLIIQSVREESPSVNAAPASTSQVWVSGGSPSLGLL